MIEHWAHLQLSHAEPARGDKFTFALALAQSYDIIEGAVTCKD